MTWLCPLCGEKLEYIAGREIDNRHREDLFICPNDHLWKLVWHLNEKKKKTGLDKIIPETSIIKNRIENR